MDHIIYIVNKTFFYSNEVGGVPDRVLSSSTCVLYIIVIELSKLCADSLNDLGVMKDFLISL